MELLNWFAHLCLDPLFSLNHHGEAAMHFAALSFAVGLASVGLDRIGKKASSLDVKSLVMESLGKIENNIVDFINSQPATTTDPNKKDISGVVGPEFIPSLNAICLLHKIPNNLAADKKSLKAYFKPMIHWLAQDIFAYFLVCKVLNGSRLILPLVLTSIAGVKLLAISMALLWFELWNWVPICSLLFDAILVGYLGFSFWRNAAVPKCGEQIGTDGKKWHQKTLNANIGTAINNPIN
jgi:hypothetical protein